MYFHTSVCGPNMDAFRSVFASAVDHAYKTKINQLALSVHSKTNLDGIISDVLGEGAIKSLKKTPLVVKGVKIGLVTERISVPFHGDVVFLAAHTSTKFLQTLEGHYQCKALFYVPWLPEELQAFLKRQASKEVPVHA